MSFVFDPTDGYRNTTEFPTTPSSQTAFRDQMMSLLDQIRDYINGTDPLGQYVKKSGDTMTNTLSILRTLSGANASMLSMIASDGKRYDLIVRSDGTLAIFNATDSITIAKFGPTALMYVGGSIITSGSGSPEGSVIAPVGSLYLRTDGSTSTTLYIKTSGTGNTGWTAK